MMKTCAENEIDEKQKAFLVNKTVGRIIQQRLLFMIEGIYEKKAGNLKKIATKGFLTVFRPTGHEEWQKKSPKKSHYRKVFFQDGGQNGHQNPENGFKSFIFHHKVVILVSKPMFRSRNPF